MLPDGIIYLNADEMAKALPGYPSQGADMQASRMLLSQMDDLEESRANFAMETTLASRSLAPRIVRLRRSDYEFRLGFVFLPDVEMAVRRVAGRVRQGGHDIPEQTIRRRYRDGVNNFFGLYQPLADQWTVYDTTEYLEPKVIARGRLGQGEEVTDPILWEMMKGRLSDV